MVSSDESGNPRYEFVPITHSSSYSILVVDGVEYKMAKLVCGDLAAIRPDPPGDFTDKVVIGTARGSTSTYQIKPHPHYPKIEGRTYTVRVSGQPDVTELELPDYVVTAIARS